MERRPDLESLGAAGFALEIEKEVDNTSTVGSKDAVILDYREDIQQTKNRLTEESTYKLIEVGIERVVEGIESDAAPPSKGRRFNTSSLKFDPAPSSPSPDPSGGSPYLSDPPSGPSDVSPDPPGPSGPSHPFGPSNPVASSAAGGSAGRTGKAPQRPWVSKNAYGIFEPETSEQQGDD